MRCACVPVEGLWAVGASQTPLFAVHLVLSTTHPSTRYNNGYSHTMSQSSFLAHPALPEELWIDILAHLSYFDLLRLERVNSVFRAIL